ncbi:MAG: hypothetical protein ACHQPI_12705 [Thermoanaerobaculia bacterium]
MSNSGSASSRPGEVSDVVLSLQLRVPETLYAPGPGATGDGSGLIIHVEIRNRTTRVWEASSRTGPLLEVVILEPDGSQRPLVLRQLPMLAFPARLEPGRGFLLPMRIVLTDIPEKGATYRLRIRVEPGTEEEIGILRFEPRPARG